MNLGGMCGIGYPSAARRHKIQREMCKIWYDKIALLILIIIILLDIYLRITTGFSPLPSKLFRRYRKIDFILRPLS